jgi:hypothetical protein
MFDLLTSTEKHNLRNALDSGIMNSRDVCHRIVSEDCNYATPGISMATSRVINDRIDMHNEIMDVIALIVM